MEDNINVEGTNWNVENIKETDSNAEDFIKRHIDNPGTYTYMTPEKKEATLNLVCKLVYGEEKE